MYLKKYILFFSFYAVLTACFGQAFTIRGTVNDEKGNRLGNVTVYLKNTKYVAETRNQGQFLLTNVAAGSYTLIISHLGYATFEKRLDLTADLSLGTIALADAATELEEVQVRTERQTKIQETRPITISSVQIKDVVAQNVLLTDVVDRISGVRIRRSSSLGDQSDISINGIRGNAIRVYIDGLPMEFIYPRFDVSTLPIGNVKRIDVYKGVLPVDVGTDAMGGGINLITEQKAYNSFRASYNIGSFNTHLADVALGLTNAKNYYLNVAGAYNYSDNSYGMDALVFEKNKVERVRRFHDKYQMSFASITAGVHSKPWADELRLSLNVSGGYKELMNGAMVANTAIGEAIYRAKNLSATVRYDKSLLSNKILFSTVGNYSDQLVTFVDTTKNVYSWSGIVVGRRSFPGEYYYSNADTYTKSWINRSTVAVTLSPSHKLLFSNLYARQKLNGTDYLETPENDNLRIPQYLNKNVAGVQYDGLFLKKLTLTTALKRFDYVLDGAENLTHRMFRKEDGIWGWNAGLKYDITQGLFVRASFEKGFLIPQFYQFVGNGADIYRNTDLLPESSDNLNLGASINYPLSATLRFSSAMNGFYRLQHDIIYLSNTIIKQYENADEVRTVGGEGDITLTYNKAWSLKTNITFMRKTFVKVRGTENQFLIGGAFPNNPNFFANTELAWTRNDVARRNNWKNKLKPRNKVADHPPKPAAYSHNDITRNRIDPFSVSALPDPANSADAERSAF